MKATSLWPVALIGLGAYLLYSKRSSASKLPSAGQMPPEPAPRPGEVIPDISFEAGGESERTLNSGSEFRVVWDPMSPYKYIAQDTDTVKFVAMGDGFITFRVPVQLATGAVSQVYVQALDENDDIVAEHKITVFGP